MKEKVIICESCEGFGHIVKRELIDYHKSEYRYDKIKCEKCKGKGRLVEITTIKIKQLR